jgi:hypothetical protein
VGLSGCHIFSSTVDRIARNMGVNHGPDRSTPGRVTPVKAQEDPAR